MSTCFAPMVGVGEVRFNRALGLQGLVVSRDAAVGRSFSSALAAAGIGSEIQLSSNIAFEHLQRDRYDLVVVDCDDLGGLELLHLARQTALNQQAIVLAVASSKNAGRDVYQAGATMVLQKAVTMRLLATTLQTVMGTMQRERRRTFRLPVEFPVVVSGDDRPPLRFSAVNISEEGMGLQGSVPLPAQHTVHIEFTLPGNAMINMAASVIWSDPHGRIGVRFQRVTSPSSAVLRRWLEGRFEHFIRELKAAPSSAPNPGNGAAVAYH